MAAKRTKAASTVPAAKKMAVAKFAEPADAEEAAAMAKMALRPSVNAAAVIVEYTKPLGEQDVGALVDALVSGIDDVNAGDMKRAEGMLYAQANALQAIFMNLARRATTQDYLKQWEGYLRMALKAQNQCRMTLETLATIKNPPVVFARQANINNGGQQQVNNGAASGNASSTRAPAHPAPVRAPAANLSTEKTELLEAGNGERLDAGAAGTPSSVDSNVEAVGAIDGAAHR